MILFLVSASWVSICKRPLWNGSWRLTTTTDLDRSSSGQWWKRGTNDRCFYAISSWSSSVGQRQPRRSLYQFGLSYAPCPLPCYLFHGQAGNTLQWDLLAHHRHRHSRLCLLLIRQLICMISSPEYLSIHIHGNHEEPKTVPELICRIAENWIIII